MKLEKVSENQIRCTLNKSDLAARELKISELAYGSEKAKDLFRDMMQQASYEFGFEAEDIPLMIEAIPVSTDCIILVITKVEDPEELDTRFSKFTPDISEEDGSEYPEDNEIYENMISGTRPERADSETEDVINLFSKVKDYLNKDVNETVNNTPESDNFIPFNKSLVNSAKDSEKPKGKTVISTAAETKMIRIFRFKDLDTVTRVSKIINSMYSNYSFLYKDIEKNDYYLLIDKTNCEPGNFNKVYNILSEYGEKISYSYASTAFMEEHFDCLIEKNALSILAKI